jgi:hypothetical protein
MFFLTITEGSFTTLIAITLAFMMYATVVSIVLKILRHSKQHDDILTELTSEEFSSKEYKSENECASMN